MNNNDDMKALCDEAQALVQLCQRLDYSAIVAHQPEAVATLQEVVRALRKKQAQGDGPSEHDGLVEPDGSKESVRPEPKSALLERQRRFVEALSRSGLGDRLGKLYSPAAERRQVAFRDAPHKLGLPRFDMVIAPDYSPINGYHGVFIGAQEVFSCVLPLPGESYRWQVRERHRFSGIEQVVDFVSRLSAGFPID